MCAYGELDLVFLYLIRKCLSRVAKYFVEWRLPGSTEICTSSIGSDGTSAILQFQDF